MYTLHNTCRACGYGPTATCPGLIPVFDHGIQPLANDFLAPQEECAGYAPLKVLLCPKCGLAQLSVVVKPSILYSKYLYVTSPSDTMRKHFEVLYSCISAEQNTFESQLEIGSNDGKLLSHFAARHKRVVGIDPAENLAAIARNNAIPTVTGVFNLTTAALALAASRDGFDVILARHVFCHVDDWAEFIESLGAISKPETLVCIEVPYVKDMLERSEHDTIYHEHLSYLNIRSVVALLEGTRFHLHRIERFSIHGGAILLMLRTNASAVAQHASVSDYLLDENITADTWKTFAETSAESVGFLRSFVSSANQNGKRVAALGASAKSTVWISACGFYKKDISFISDTTTQKLYKLSPGTDIPITDEGAILRELPDYVICFCWNFREEVLAKNSLARSKGVKFVFPVPSLEIV